VNGKDYKAVESPDGQFPVIGTGGVMARATDYLTPENSIVIGRKGTIDKPFVMTEKYWNVDTAFGVVPHEEINYLYLFWYCKQLDFSKLNKATTLPSTTKADLLNLYINIPDMELQKQFASLVVQSDKSKNVAEQETNIIIKVISLLQEINLRRI